MVPGSLRPSNQLHIDLYHDTEKAGTPCVSFFWGKETCMSNFKETLQNLMKYLEGRNISKRLDAKGFIVIENVNDITCFIDFIVDDRCKCLSITIHPCITCLEPEKDSLRKYFESVHNMFYSGQLLLDQNGAICIQISQKYIDAPLSVETIAFMFFEISSILDFTLEQIKQIVYNLQDNC